MRALTICEPFASLICLPDDDPRMKRVENRGWATKYRGPLLIHAGKNRQWLCTCRSNGIPESDLTFGAILGIAELRDCVTLLPHNSDAAKMIPVAAHIRWPWLATHRHTEGPVCLVLQEVRRFKKPIPWNGKQGLFEIPDEIVAEAIATDFDGRTNPGRMQFPNSVGQKPDGRRE